MEFLNELMGGVATAGAGGVLGLFGGIAGAVAKVIQKKQEMAHQERQWAHELELQRLEQERSREEDEHELRIANNAGSWGALTTSIQAFDPGSGGSPTVNAIRSLFRPFLTVLLLAMAGWMFYLVVTVPAVRSAFPDELYRELVRYIVFSVVFTAATAAVWWFADRALTPPEYKNR